MVAKLIPPIFQRPAHYLCVVSVMMLYVKVISKLEFGAVFCKDAKIIWTYPHIS